MRMHHAGLSVPDLDRALAWYCAALGLRPGYQFEVPLLIELVAPVATAAQAATEAEVAR